MLLTSSSDHKDINKVSETRVKSHANHQNEFNLQVRTIVPPDLNHIQPRAPQVWNCDKIGLEPNCKWRKVVCTYRNFQGKMMRKVQTGEIAPFWCTLLVFTRADGKFFMPPVIFHQDKESSQNLHHNIPLDWTVHHTSSSYMYRDGCLKAMNQLSNICGANPINNQILFFDGHDSQFDDRALTKMKIKNIQPFILKAGESINDQPNDNVHNSKLKAFYNISKV